MGESNKLAISPKKSSVAVDTFAGRVHVEWDPAAAVTPLGQLPFFIEFLEVSGIFDAWVESCPLKYTSPNAPAKRDVLGTLLLSILAGHKRYAHITSIRCDGVNPELLRMRRVVSEDAIRRALSNMKEDDAVQWQEQHLRNCTDPLLFAPWILDTDTTVKTLYGKQEGAVVGYNPRKPGRPSHTLHSYFMANTRLVLNVEVQPGNKTAAQYTAPGLWALLSKIPRDRWPKFIRGDSAFGVEPVMVHAEHLGLPYLSKLRLTRNVKRLIEKTFRHADWADAGQGWEGVDERLQLDGWTKTRRVVVLRRRLRGDIALSAIDETRQFDLSFVEADSPMKSYEYAVLVTSLGDEILTIAQHYRDRADSENNFDELKNQWGWGGFTTHDMKRCRISSRAVALVYNWWSLYTRLANPDKHHEAITARPLLMHAVAKKVQHAGQTKITITSTHAKAGYIQEILTKLALFLKSLKQNAEQLTATERWQKILTYAFRRFLGNLAPPKRISAISSA